MTVVPTPNSAPNMDLTVLVEKYAYTFEFRTFRDLTYLTIRNDAGYVVAGNVRCCNGQWLINSQARNYPGAGNFRFECSDGQYPIFSAFGNTCRLVYYSRAELEV